MNDDMTLEELEKQMPVLTHQIKRVDEVKALAVALWAVFRCETEYPFDEVDKFAQFKDLILERVKEAESVCLKNEVEIKELVSIWGGYFGYAKYIEVW